VGRVTQIIASGLGIESSLVLPKFRSLGSSLSRKGSTRVRRHRSVGKPVRCQRCVRQVGGLSLGSPVHLASVFDIFLGSSIHLASLFDIFLGSSIHLASVFDIFLGSSIHLASVFDIFLFDTVRCRG
jgi:hypothetical protein